MSSHNTPQRNPSVTANDLRGDPVIRPWHYTSHPSGVECITITEHMPFNVGNAMKYLWRAGLKGSPEDHIQDLRKAAWYTEREIQRLTNLQTEAPTCRSLT